MDEFLADWGGGFLALPFCLNFKISLGVWKNFHLQPFSLIGLSLSWKFEPNWTWISFFHGWTFCWFRGGFPTLFCLNFEISLRVWTSVLDPNFFGGGSWSRYKHFSGSGFGSRQIKVMIPMDRARNSDQFTFLKFENPSSGSKVRSHQSWALFVQKSIF